MTSDRSPIIPVQFVPLLENACRNNPAKAAFLVLSLIEAWRGSADDAEVPSEYLDAWLALQGNLRIIEAKVEGGKKGGRPPKTSGTEGLPPKTSCASRTRALLGEARQGEERRGKNTPLNPPEGGGDDVEFDAFWDAYGKKEGRKDAERAFAKAKKSKSWPGIDAVLAKVAEWRRSEKWTKEGGKYQSLASVWLNGERWNDELPQEPKSQDDDGWDRSRLP